MCEGCGCHVLESIYQPLPAKVIQCKQVSQEYYKVSCAFDKEVKTITGQYVMGSVPGFPEVLFDICATLEENNGFDLFIHKTNVLHKVIAESKVGDILSIRGPFGKGFDLEALNNQDICFVVDEKGFSSVRPVLIYVLRHKEKYRNVTLCFPGNVMDDELRAMCEKNPQVQMQIFKDNDDKGKVYRSVFSKPENKQVKYIIALPSLSMQDIMSSDLFSREMFDNYYMSLSHFIHCGVGTCGHCNTGALCVCTNGPFFKLSDISKNMGLISNI